MSLTSGMTSIDVCAILDSCRKNGVSSIVIGDMVVEFANRSSKSPSKHKEKHCIEAVYKQPELDFDAKYNDNGTSGQEADIDNKELTEEMIQNLMLEEPLVYEQVMKEMAGR